MGEEKAFKYNGLQCFNPEAIMIAYVKFIMVNFKFLIAYIEFHKERTLILYLTLDTLNKNEFYLYIF